MGFARGVGSHRESALRDVRPSLFVDGNLVHVLIDIPIKLGMYVIPVILRRSEDRDAVFVCIYFGDAWGEVEEGRPGMIAE